MYNQSHHFRCSQTSRGIHLPRSSRVLNNTVPVDERDRRQVKEVAAALNYTPHAAARTLASRRTNTIACSCWTSGVSSIRRCCAGIEAVGCSQTWYDC